MCAAMGIAVRNQIGASRAGEYGNVMHGSTELHILLMARLL